MSASSGVSASSGAVASSGVSVLNGTSTSNAVTKMDAVYEANGIVPSDKPNNTSSSSGGQALITKNGEDIVEDKSKKAKIGTKKKGRGKPVFRWDERTSERLYEAYVATEAMYDDINDYRARLSNTDMTELEMKERMRLEQSGEEEPSQPPFGLPSFDIVCEDDDDEVEEEEKRKIGPESSMTSAAVTDHDRSVQKKELVLEPWDPKRFPPLVEYTVKRQIRDKEKKNEAGEENRKKTDSDRETGPGKEGETNGENEEDEGDEEKKSVEKKETAPETKGNLKGEPGDANGVDTGKMEVENGKDNKTKARKEVDSQQTNGWQVIVERGHIPDCPYLLSIMYLTNTLSLSLHRHKQGRLHRGGSPVALLPHGEESLAGVVAQRLDERQPYPRAPKTHAKEEGRGGRRRRGGGGEGGSRGCCE